MWLFEAKQSEPAFALLYPLSFVVFAAVFSTVVLGVVNVKLGIVENWTLLSSELGWLRFGSTHVNPNLAAFYLVVGLPLVDVAHDLIQELPRRFLVVRAHGSLLNTQGAVGVSGDGVDQDDLVASAGAAGFDAPDDKRCDQLFVRGVRLPYVKFPRHPEL